MTRLIASFFLASLPWTINAEPIDVDYEGVVGSVFTEEGGAPFDDYHVGQRIKGRLTIYTERAGPDTSSSPGIGTYYGSDFVVGNLLSLPGSSPSDAVIAEPWGPKPSRHYSIVDRLLIDRDNEMRFTIAVDQIPKEIGDDDVWQAFTAEPEKDGSRIWSVLSRVKNGVTSGVLFLFNKVSVVPRSCHAP